MFNPPKREKEVKSVARAEIEQKIATSGDYVKIDYLSSCLKKNIDFDTKKFVLLKLAQLYESRRMLLEAAKMMRSAAEINTTYDGKMNDFMKSSDLFIRAGSFDEADVCFTKALGCANEAQKARIKNIRKEGYKAQAKEFMSKDRRTHAMTTYQKILGFDLTPEEKREAQSTLLFLYEKLGKVKEYYSMKANLG